ncbi:hypothetical protein HDU86_008344 [Geranomyces michiganensis]|nr:hypothetical protein HDU86_008344 [Geranomyces michiganensis]
MKSMIANFISDAEHDSTLKLHVWTFTEDRGGCYITKSSPDFTPVALRRWVDNTELGYTGEGHCANGGDGPENSVAAVSALMDSFTVNDSVVCFLITDNAPHRAAFQSPEAEAEKRWLTAQDPAAPIDMYERLAYVLDRTNVTLVPLLLSSFNQSQCELLLQQPISTWAHALDALHAAFHVAVVDPLMFPFQVEDVGEVVMPTEVANTREEVEAAFYGLLATTVDRFTGKRARRRCRSVSPDLIAASVRVFVLSMLIRTGKASETQSQALTAAQEQLTQCLESTQQSGEIKHVNKFIEYARASPPVKPRAGSGEHCIISLQTAWDTLSELDQPVSDEDVTVWMNIVLELVHCVLVDVKFPVNAQGNQDFYDAWSTTINRVACSTMLSAKAAVLLRSESEDGASYQDPISRALYNGAVLLAHGDDLVLACCYEALSALPSLAGLLQGYLMSGGIQIFPSLAAGVQAATAMYLVRQAAERLTNMSSIEWDVCQALTETLAMSQVVPAHDVVKALLAQLNPVDNTSRLFAALITYIRRTSDPSAKYQAVRLFFEEYATESIRRIINWREADIKSAPDMAYLPLPETVADCFVQTRPGFDPLTSRHPVEGATIKTEAGMNRLQELLVKSKAFQVASMAQTTIGELLETPESVPSQDVLLRVFAESLLLGKRTMRYYLNEDKPTWTRKEVNIDEQVRSYIDNVYKLRLGKWKVARAALARDRLMTSQIPMLEPDLSEYEYVQLLKDNDRCEHLGQIYRLNRMDAIELLERLGDRAKGPRGYAVVRGSWTSEPPSQLRRHYKIISKYVDASEEMRRLVLAQAVCLRERPNRSGHTKTTPFPGFIGWTQEYHDRRLAATTKPSIQTRLEAMKHYHEYMEATTKAIASWSSDQQALALAVLHRPLSQDDVPTAKYILSQMENGTCTDPEAMAAFSKRCLTMCRKVGVFPKTS